MVGIGRFHHCLLSICGSLYLANAISVTSLSLVLPLAQCDFHMTSAHKGVLNGALMTGMVVGSFIWGYVADTKGRRYTLVVSILMDGICNLFSSVSQVYPIFLMCRLLSGFGLSSIPIMYLYLVEFLDAKYRERYLAWMGIFWSIGLIILPCMAWIIMLYPFRIENEYFLFKTWNMLVIICSLPSMLLAFLLTRMPESPKFLLAKGKHDEAIDCLRTMYRWNNKSDDKFPVTCLLQTMPNHVIDKAKSNFFHGLYKSTVELFTSKYKVIAWVVSVILFCSSTSYYMLIMWFPELMNRFQWYETLNKDIQIKKTMCEIVSIVEPNTRIVEKCTDHIDQSVFINIIIIGIVCVLPNIIVPLLANKFGIRFFTVVSFVGSAVSAAWLYFITSSTENLILSCIFEALSGAGIGLVYCIAVDLFPIEYNGMATSIGTMFGKLGALIGNILTGIFIDVNCIVPITFSCLFLIISALLILILPKPGRTNFTI
ncbi:synaptic vesicle glycoprotein 2A-like isoform X2 [Sipha flava]|nr:synaptic vesicle glycoprotein 2A-like isoform X2 [Sipha flava]